MQNIAPELGPRRRSRLRWWWHSRTPRPKAILDERGERFAVRRPEYLLDNSPDESLSDSLAASRRAGARGSSSTLADLSL